MKTSFGLSSSAPLASGAASVDCAALRQRQRQRSIFGFGFFSFFFLLLALLPRCALPLYRTRAPCCTCVPCHQIELFQQQQQQREQKQLDNNNMPEIIIAEDLRATG